MEYFRKKHEKNIDDNVWHTIVRDNDIRFAEFELGGEEKNIAVPARMFDITEEDRQSRSVGNVQKNHQAAELSMDDLNFQDGSSENIRYYSSEQQFVIRARELAWHTEPEHSFVPFKNYWPTYDHMSTAQFQWYFYWRDEVRSGRYPETDLSYIFVYMYELINGVGWTHPAQGWQLLESVWQAYRQRFPKLDAYAREWLFDFSLVHELNTSVTETYNSIPRSLSSELKELEWMRRFTAEPLELNWNMLIDMMDYEPKKSRFFQEGGRKDMRKYGPKVVALVDAYLGKTTGKRLIDMFKPKERKQERYIFRSAVYDYDIYGRTVTVMTLPISEHAPLRHYITNLMRMMENKLRELRGFKGRLRGIESDPEIEKLVVRFLKKELQLAEREQKGKTEQPKIKINRVKLRRLQQESDDVREMLLVDDAESVQSVPLNVKETELGRRKQNAKPAIQSNKNDVPIQLDIFELNRFESDLVMERPAGKQEAAGTELSIETATVQETDKLPVTDIDQGFRNESVEEADLLHTEEVVTWHTENLDEAWRQLVRLLTPVHLEALYALKTGPDMNMLQAAAERAGSMPQLLIDEINDAAMETIGDLLIDGETIADEYITMLDQLTR